ncbi:hypothetical protein LIER_19455 [Lithospermum erythrorhizon]|uniref:Reverse transcriptase/retrotransposon-derived protein RNase H-like domain-containing protein n=1 Tax=Lithospermum erythrorhizon TaxID=34254 RepID=A0AAV3QKW8_LITER
MKTPNSYKEVQKLTGCLAALNRFISKSGERNLPFFKNLRRISKEKFTWDEECKTAFEELKRYLGSPQLLSRPEPGEHLQLYLAISDVAVSSVLVREVDRVQRPIYYINHVLRDAEERCPTIDKAAFALIVSARKLKAYFESHPVQVMGLTIIKERGASGVLIMGPQEEIMEYALRFIFPAINNEAEYKAMILGLRQVRSMGIEE